MTTGSLSATGALIQHSTSPRARRRRSEARDKLALQAVGYLRVSTDEQAASGLGLEAQRTAVEHLATARGLTVTAWHVDAGISGANIGKRPAFLNVLRDLDEGKAGVLLAKDATRLTRNLADLGALLDAATRDGWDVITTDGLVDTTTEQGRLLPMFLGIVGELERTFTKQRTKAALQAAKARGVRLGKRSTLPEEVADRIVLSRSVGATWQSIADDLNRDQVPTGQGGSCWRPSSVRAVWISRNAA